jgi:hypothetical protein
MPRRIAQLLLLLVPAVPLAAAAGALFAPGHRGPFLRAIVVALVLPMAAVLSVSSRIPLWLPRYFVLLTPFLAVLLAVGLARLRPSPLAAAWGILLFLSNGYACFRYDVDYSKERWRDVVHAIEARRGAGHTAAMVTFDADPFRYFNVRLARPVDAFEVSHADVPFASGYTPEQLDAMERAAARRAAAYDEVWVVVRSPNSAVRRQLVVRANQAAAIGRVRAGRWRWDSTNGPVWATRYVRAAGDSSGAGTARGTTP